MLAILVLVGVRIALPSWIKDKINHTLENDLTDYKGHIEDFRLFILGGNYYVEGLQLRKKTAPVGEDLLRIKEMKVHLSWRALFHRRVLLDATLREPQLNIFDSKNVEEKQNGSDESNWQTLLSSLFPFNLQSLSLEKGTFHFINKSAVPPVDLTLEQIDFVAHDLGNILQRDDPLPSSFNFAALIQGKSKIILSGKANLLTPPFALKADLDLGALSLNTLNPYFWNYGYFTIHRGDLAARGKIDINMPKVDLLFLTGFREVKVLGAPTKFRGLRGLITDFAVGFFNILARDHRTLVTTELHVAGQWPDLKVDYWRALKEAFQ